MKRNVKLRRQHMRQGIPASVRRERMQCLDCGSVLSENEVHQHTQSTGHWDFSMLRLLRMGKRGWS